MLSLTHFRTFFTASFIALVISACGGGGGDASPAETPNNQQQVDSSLPDVTLKDFLAYAGEDRLVKSQVSVELRGIVEIPSNREVVRRTWTFSAGDIAPIELEQDSTGIAKFISPNVVERTTVSFDFEIENDLGELAKDSISVVIEPSLQADIDFNFVSFRFLEEEPNAVHGKFYPIEGNPKPIKTKAIVEYFGAVSDVVFSAVGLDSQEISVLQIDATNTSDRGIQSSIGDIDVPSEQFRIMAVGNLHTGQAFQVIYPHIYDSNKTGLEIRLEPTSVLMRSGESQTISYYISNSGDSASVLVKLESSNEELLPSSEDIVFVDGEEERFASVDIPSTIASYQNIRFSVSIYMSASPSVLIDSDEEMIEVLP